MYCLDCQFLAEMPKFVAGCLNALSAMVQLELPHVNVLTKMDLCEDREDAERFLFPDGREVQDALDAQTGPAFRKLNKAVSSARRAG